ncbi:MAG: glycosyltransferase [Algicola sp.]|nr:glycosyltransferase [Algicola sp.]
MKVLHIGKYSPPFFGGIENFMMDLGQACDAQNVKSAAIVHHHQAGQKFDKRDIDGMTVYRVPCYGQLMFAPVSPAFGFYLNKVIDEFKPDILHFHMPNTSAFFALFSAKARALKWVVHWHSDVLGDDSPWFLRAFYPFYRPLESWVLKRAKKVIATSAPYLQSSMALKKITNKCQVIELGIKPRKGPAAQARLRHEDQPLQLLVVGRLTYYKGHRFLIDALLLLKRQGLTKIKLNIVGGGELYEQLQQQVEQLGLSSQVLLHGKVSFDALQSQFEQAHCVCLASIERTEAFGVVLMEAASFAVPAIVTNVPGSGMSWAVQHGQTGLVVNRSDAQALANGIEDLYRNPQQLFDYAQAAHQRFLQHFQIEAVASTTIELYRSVSEQS